MRQRRGSQPGCLGGLLRLFALRAIYDWLQRTFGRKKGGCIGAGCGLIFFIIFTILVCSVLTGTDWMSFTF